MSGRGLVVRALIAGLVVVLSTAGAVAAAGLLELGDIRERWFPDPLDIPVTPAEAGDPRTFLLLGSDARYDDRRTGDPPRSDTMLLVRADPDANAIAVTSVPRDLKVRLPGIGTAKINSAYERGGPRATLRALRRLFERATGEEFPIHHVFNVDFGGFRRAVDYVGGVYVDVDREYFNDNAPPVDSVEPYATIDVDPGYRKLDGRDALAYVRYRHGDNDFVRAARQQDFLRQLRRQPAVRDALRVQDRERLGDIFGRYLEVDRSFRSTAQLVSLLKLGLALSDAPVVEVPFAATEEPLPSSYVTASKRQLRQTVRRFLRPGAAGATGRARGSRAGRSGPARRLPPARTEGEDRAIVAARRLDFPFYFPARIAPGSSYVDPAAHVYQLEDERGDAHRAYRLVLRHEGVGAFYGIQGTSWREPPILGAPDERRRVHGRTLRIYRDGARVRIVAWRTRRAVYWVSNTLTRTLSRSEMLGIAASLRRLG